MFEKFTPPARRIVAVANEQAASLGKGYVGTEHILLALCREQDGIVAEVLRSADLDPQRVRNRVEQTAGRDEHADAVAVRPFTPRTKNLLGRALQEALHREHERIEVEHILLALVSRCDGVAISVLRSLNVSPKQIREELLRRMPGSAGKWSMPELPNRIWPFEEWFPVGITDDARALLFEAVDRALRSSRGAISARDIVLAAIENPELAPILESAGLEAIKRALEDPSP